VTPRLTSVGIGSASFTGSSAGRVQQRFHLREAGAARRSQGYAGSMIAKAREILTHYPKDLRTSVGRRPMDPAEDRPMCSLRSPGPISTSSTPIRKTLLAKLKQIPKVADADTSLVYGKPELRVEIDRQRAADLGVRVNDIAQALNTMVAGQVVSSFPSGGEEYDVRLRADMQFRTSAEGLRQLTFSRPTRGLGAAGSSGPHQERRRALQHRPSGPAARGDAERQRVAGRIAAEVISTLNQFAEDLHMDPGYRTGTPRHFQRAGPHRLLFHARHRADVHLHVHRAGGAV
jgi:HAE1 family hydrophobic/amphiphilic exporter-1